MSATDILPTQAMNKADTDDAQAVRVPVAKAREDLMYVRVIRAFALLIIVTQHVSFPLIYQYNNLSYSDWWIGNAFYMWGKAGSPLFVMVSGLLLLNPSRDEPISVFFRKRFLKVLWPFVVWSFIYLLWRIYARGEEFTGREILIMFVQGPVYYHLWFIQMILGLYLATPILRIYIRHATRDNLRYFLIIWFFAASIFPIVKRYFGFEIGITVAVTTGFVGFYVLGYYLRPIKLTMRQLSVALAVVVTALLATQFLTHASTVRNDGIFDNFYELNDSFNLIIIAVGIFLYLKSLDYTILFEKLPWFGKLVQWISSTSLGIYFVHVLVIEELAGGRLGFTYDGLTFNPLISIPLGAVVVMAISVLITKLLQSIPYVRTIVP